MGPAQAGSYFTGRTTSPHTQTRTRRPTEGLLSPGLEMDFALADHMGLIHISIDLDEEMNREGRNEIRRGN